MRPLRSRRGTIVADWNAYEVGPERKPPKPAGPVLTNISTLAACAAFQIGRAVTFSL